MKAIETINLSHTYPDGTIMHKVVCAHCNNLRALCGHCWGAVACVRAVTKVSPMGSRRAEHNKACEWRLFAPPTVWRAA